MKTLLTFIVVGLCAACYSPFKSDHSTTSAKIVVAASANLNEVLPELTNQFTRDTGIGVVSSFGATADLARQIENGAPFDVFASADTLHMDNLATKGLLTPGSRALYARGRLVMWVPANGLKAERIEDISGAAFERVAIAKPDIAPYGRATIESLEALGIWKQIERKVVYGQSVAQTKQFAATGNAEVAFIPLALVKPGEGTYLQIDEHLHQPINQALGIMKASPNPEAARKFVDFLLSPPAQEILQRKGYFSVTAL